MKGPLGEGLLGEGQRVAIGAIKGQGRGLKRPLGLLGRGYKKELGP